MNNQTKINDIIIEYQKLIAKQSNVKYFNLTVSFTMILIITVAIVVVLTSSSITADIAIGLLIVFVILGIILMLVNLVFNRYSDKLDTFERTTEQTVNEIFKEIGDMKADVTWIFPRDVIEMNITLGKKYDDMSTREINRIKVEVSKSLGESIKLFNITYWDNGHNTKYRNY